MSAARRRVYRGALAGVALAASLGAHAALPAPARVSFPSLDRDASGNPVAVSALYFRPPQAAPDVAVPLIVAAHGCGGMFSANAKRRDQLSERFAAWTEQFLAEGYAVLWPDSFNSRGRRSVCLAKRGEAPISPMTRRLDVIGALAFAADDPGVDRTRMALVGWSHGGSTALAATNGRDAAVAFGTQSRRDRAVQATSWRAVRGGRQCRSVEPRRRPGNWPGRSRSCCLS